VKAGDEHTADAGFSHVRLRWLMADDEWLIADSETLCP
jgi:hypothetical protein